MTPARCPFCGAPVDDGEHVLLTRVKANGQTRETYRCPNVTDAGAEKTKRATAPFDWR